MIEVELATSVDARRVRLQRVSLPDGATVRDVLQATGSNDLSLACEVGVWGRVRPLDWPLRSGDRVELYRPLTVHPMEARRLRQASIRRQKTQTNKP